jgi:hypothetical protein
MSQLNPSLSNLSIKPIAAPPLSAAANHGVVATMSRNSRRALRSLIGRKAYQVLGQIIPRRSETGRHRALPEKFCVGCGIDIGWASLATPLLAVLGASQFFKVRPIIQDAILSCLLTFGFYFIFYLDQAHGWGYRYFHGAIACLIIVAVAGFNRLSILVGEHRATKFVLAGIAGSLLIQFPLRCFEAERFVRPYAQTAAVLHAIPKDIVAFDFRDAWYSADFIRNDPFLENRPVIVSIVHLTPPAIAALEKNGTVRFITREDFTRLGMFTTRSNNYSRDPFKLGRGK